MRKTKYSFGQLYITQLLLRPTLLIGPVSFSIDLLVASFLWLLDLAAQARRQQLRLIYLLPLAGIFTTWLYGYFGKDDEGGNNQILVEIHTAVGGVPARITSLIFMTTILTHLFNGSAGNESTAVQMSSSIASQFATNFRLHDENKRAAELWYFDK